MMDYKYQVSVFSYYYPTVALFVTKEEALVYYKDYVSQYKGSCLVTISELLQFDGEPELPLIEWY